MFVHIASAFSSWQMDATVCAPASVGAFSDGGATTWGSIGWGVSVSSFGVANCSCMTSEMLRTRSCGTPEVERRRNSENMCETPLLDADDVLPEAGSTLAIEDTGRQVGNNCGLAPLACEVILNEIALREMDGLSTPTSFSDGDAFPPSVCKSCSAASDAGQDTDRSETRDSFGDDDVLEFQYYDLRCVARVMGRVLVDGPENQDATRGLTHEIQYLEGFSGIECVHLDEERRVLRDAFRRVDIPYVVRSRSVASAEFAEMSIPSFIVSRTPSPSPERRFW
eukprot:TRINITY_DN3939_c0_g1_i6.p1 TRINITY_DN3939_c0_g1~~TRINITY_DN3939_c0_g1_i6.p1  ORF type:complete len:281 (+),score=44.21 TRINITY_DN3939_c0_g1_i6:921-1763(+)